MRISSLFVRGFARGLSVLGLGAVVIFGGGCSKDQMTLGGLLAKPGLAAGEKDDSVTGVSLNPMDWGRDRQHELAVETAKSDSSDPVLSALVKKTKGMYWAPTNKGFAFVSESTIASRQKLVDKRDMLDVTQTAEVAELDQQITKASNEMRAKEIAGYTALQTENDSVKSEDEKVKAQIAKRKIWIAQRLIDVKTSLPDGCKADTFAVALTPIKYEGDATMAAK